MKNEIIINEIYSQNRHWRSDKTFFEDINYRRYLFSEILQYLPDRQILSVVGIRRTGKTILLKQIVKYLIEEKYVEPVDILFLSFDEALLTKTITLKEYIDNFLEINENNHRKYILFDEIQYADKWQHILKRYYDQNLNLKFIISGSSSLYLKKKSTESLTGRIYDFKLNPLNFEEYLELSGAKQVLIDGYKNLSLKAGNYCNQPERDYLHFIHENGANLKHCYEKYILYHQFPETIFLNNNEKIKRYLRDSIYKKTIEYDIPRLFGIGKTEELKFIFRIMIHDSGNILEYKNISSEAGIEENTLKRYINYFEQSFLLDLVYNYSSSIRKSKRLQKKGYIASPNFYTAFHSEYIENPLLSNQNIGKLIETYIFQLLKKYFENISFFKKGANEVDFLATEDFLNKSDYRIIEVKYANQIRKSDLSFISKISNSVFKVKKYIVYSKDEFHNDEEKMIIPCYLLK
jgi:uncharacterized protein